MACKTKPLVFDAITYLPMNIWMLTARKKLASFWQTDILDIVTSDKSTVGEHSVFGLTRFDCIFVYIGYCLYSVMCLLSIWYRIILSFFIFHIL